MIRDNEVNIKSLFMVNFLDVGGGICTGLCALALYHGVSAVSIEKCPQTFKGSLLRLENANNIMSINFIH